MPAPLAYTRPLKGNASLLCLWRAHAPKEATTQERSGPERSGRAGGEGQYRANNHAKTAVARNGFFGALRAPVTSIIDSTPHSTISIINRNIGH